MYHPRSHGRWRTPMILKQKSLAVMVPVGWSLLLVGSGQSHGTVDGLHTNGDLSGPTVIVRATGSPVFGGLIDRHLARGGTRGYVQYKTLGRLNHLFPPKQGTFNISYPSHYLTRRMLRTLLLPATCHAEAPLLEAVNLRMPAIYVDQCCWPCKRLAT